MSTENTQVFTQSKDSTDINLDEIMERIREEVVRSKATNLTGEGVLTSQVKETGLFRRIKKIQSFLRKLPFYKQINSIALKFKRFVPKYEQPELSVAELINFNDDDDFVKNAYRLLLHREPDESGYSHYLNRLKTRSLSRVQILGKLRCSKEGRQVKVKIIGFPEKYIVSALFRNKR